jgi:hypothetical protein
MSMASLQEAEGMYVCMYVCTSVEWLNITINSVLVKGSGDRHLPGSFINEVEEALVETAKEVSL